MCSQLPDCGAPHEPAGPCANLVVWTWLRSSYPTGTQKSDKSVIVGKRSQLEYRFMPCVPDMALILLAVVPVPQTLWDVVSPSATLVKRGCTPPPVELPAMLTSPGNDAPMPFSSIRATPFVRTWTLSDDGLPRYEHRACWRPHVSNTPSS